MKRFTYLLLSILTFSSAGAQNFGLLSDIHQESTSEGSSPYGFFELNGQLFYFLYNEDDNSALMMKSDLTNAGTVPVKIVSYFASGSISSVQVVGNKAFFAGYDADYGTELWITDGTASGTKMLKDINPGADNASTYVKAVLNGKAYFTAYDPVNGNELWVSDGTANGTVLVKDINPGANSSDIGTILVMGNSIYFAADDGTNGMEMYVSDGTANGTTMITDFNTGAADGVVSPNHLAILGGYVYFGGSDATLHALCRTNGTAQGTENVTIFTLDGGTIREMSAMPDNKLYMAVNAQSYGTEPWVSDGTANGTQLLGDFVAGVNGTGNIYDFTWYNNKVFFSIYDDLHGKEVFTSDGTPVGTTLYADIVAGTGNSLPKNFCVANNTLFFQARGAGNVSGTELWKIEAGQAPQLVKDLDPGTTSEADGSMLAFNNKLVYQGNTLATGEELFVSDGTVNGTGIVNDFSTLYLYQAPANLEAAGNLVLFRGTTTTDPEVWSTDGTIGGTALLKDIDANNSSFPNHITAFGNKFLFSAREAASGTEIYISDGTANGTVLLKDLVPGAGNSSPQSITPVNPNDAYFLAGNNGPYKLWRTDGTAGNTVQIGTENAGAIAAGPPGYIYFDYADIATGNELFYSLGLGVVATTDINPGADGSSPEYITAHGSSKMIFSAYEPTAGKELYICDVLSGNATLVKDINPGSEGSYLYNTFHHNGLTYFAAWDGVSGYEPWVTDGTTNGTFMLKDIFPGVGNGNPTSFAALGNNVVFGATDPVNGWEIWISDGTTNGTHILTDICPGTASSFAMDFKTVGNYVVFSAKDQNYGIELWQTDGTASGTYMLADINPDGSSYPQEMTVSGNLLFFTAYTPDYGREIWTFDLLTLDVAPLENHTLTVYPNPSTEIVNISGDWASTEAEVEIWSITGQKVLSQKMMISNGLISLDVASLAPSAYILRVGSDDSTFTSTFIKQ